jgi:CheY-like chemotaxis protein
VSTYLDFQPNIALLDIAMPGLSGLDICKQLRALACDRHPKIIAQTGYGDVASVRKIEQAGFDEILLKPVDPEKLRLAINRFAMPEI